MPTRRRSYQLSSPFCDARNADSGQNSDESLGEDMLLSGHASAERWSRAVGRRVAGKSAPEGDS